MAETKIHFLANETAAAQESLAALINRYGQAQISEASVVVALGGEGFMLTTLYATQELEIPVYGMNRGSVGFLMNAYSEDALLERLNAVVPDPRYSVSREYLLNESNYYSHEFNLFLNEFARDISGDPSFHFHRGLKSIPAALVKLVRPSFGIYPR